MMNLESFIEKYLYQNIPISQAMGIKVEHASKDRIVLSAPFLNNINHKKTVFGGSLHAVATLACWCLLYVNLDETVQIVITKSEVSYLLPVDDQFFVECLMPEEIVWQRFVKTLHAKGKARIHLSAQILHHGKLSVDYKGTFAALKSNLSISEQTLKL